ncbi:MAG: hypothetical protein IJ571_00450 [Ruminococcus sp.]|nr:hypothetical protein [Ruminococcus sp.]
MKNSIESILVKEISSQIGIDPNSKKLEVSEFDILEVKNHETGRTTTGIVILISDTMQLVYKFTLSEGEFVEGYSCGFERLDYDKWCRE